jgi:ketosteroid isomerase-like protein
MDLFFRTPTRFRKSMPAILCVSMMVMWLPGRLEAGPCASAHIKDEIVAANKRFSEAAAAHDASAISQMYTETAELLPPGQSVVIGRAAIKSFWAAGLKSVSAVSLTAVEVECTDDLAIERGVFVMTTAQGKASGKYLVVWKHVNGQWMLHRDCWNSDAP